MFNLHASGEAAKGCQKTVHCAFWQTAKTAFHQEMPVFVCFTVCIPKHLWHPYFWCRLVWRVKAQIPQHRPCIHTTPNTHELHGYACRSRRREKTIRWYCPPARDMVGSNLQTSDWPKRSLNMHGCQKMFLHWIHQWPNILNGHTISVIGAISQTWSGTCEWKCRSTCICGIDVASGTMTFLLIKVSWLTKKIGPNWPPGRGDRTVIVSQGLSSPMSTLMTLQPQILAVLNAVCPLQQHQQHLHYVLSISIAIHKYKIHDM